MDFDYTTETITPDATGILTIAGVGGIEIPIGLTSERPVSPILGTLRYNSTTALFEGYQAGLWVNFTGGSGTVTSVAATGSTGLTVGGSPITTSGTLTFTLDTGLQNLASFASTGLLTATGTDTWTARELTGTTNRITVTNGTGVAGNPTVDIASTYVGQTSITTLGTITTGTWNGTTIAVNRGGTGLTATPTNGQLLIGNGTGYTLSTLTQPAAGLTITNGAGSITFALANDLAAVEGLATTGLATRTGTDTWTTRTITGTTDTITVTNGSGVAGNPTITIADNPILPGTAGMVLPDGTTGDRPLTPAPGTVRYNTTLGKTEVFQDGVWYQLGTVTPGGVGIVAVYTGVIPATSGVSTVPFDNTTPLVTEGTEIWSRTLSASQSTSTMKFTVPFTVDSSTSNRVVIASLFRGTVNIGSAVWFATGGGRPTTITISISDSPGVTTPILYSMRTGIGAGSGTWYVNSTSSGNDLGGALVSSYEITEVV